MKKNYLSRLLLPAVFPVLLFLLFSCGGDKETERMVVPPDPNKPTTVTDYYPHEGGVATKLIIHGTNFGTDTAYIKVSVNGKNARVIASDGDAIYAIVPSRAGTGDVEVQIGKNGDIKRLPLADKFDYTFRENVITIAGQVGLGGDASVPPPDDSEGTMAMLRRPWAVMTDPDGALFFLEEGRGSNRDGGLRQVKNGKVTTIVRNAGANFRSPAALAFSLGGDSLFLMQTLYAGDNGMTLDDPIIVLFLRDDGFQVPRRYIVNNTSEIRVSGIAVHPVSGDIFIGGARDGNIYKVNRATQSVEVCKKVETASPYTANRIHGVSLAFSPSGDYLYVASAYKHQIYRLKYNAGVTEPSAIFDTQGDVRVEVFAGSGTKGFRDGIGSSAQFDTPGQITCDNDGNLYVADRMNHCIRRITPLGAVTTFAGRPGVSGYEDGLPLESLFYQPESIHYSKASDVWYVADCDNQLLRRISVE